MINLKIYKNGASVSGSYIYTDSYGAVNIDDLQVQRSLMLQLNAGDTVDVRHQGSVSGTSAFEITFCAKLEYEIT